MIRFRGTLRRTSFALLALLLLAAQSVALAHVYEHELGTAQAQSCTACVTASQLASACVDTTTLAQFYSYHSLPVIRLDIELIPTQTPVIRQRGPPTPH